MVISKKITYSFDQAILLQGINAKMHRQKYEKSNMLGILCRDIWNIS